MSEDWITELLDLGIGSIAVDYLYRIQRGLTHPEACPNCGYSPRKFSMNCPKCRRPLR